MKHQSITRWKKTSGKIKPKIQWEKQTEGKEDNASKRKRKTLNIREQALP